MSKDLKHIDHLFADSLGEHMDEHLDLDLNWNAVEKGINKYSFFRFQINKFNIYYLSAICANVLVLGWVWIYALQHPIVIESTKSTVVSDSSFGNLKSDLSIKPSPEETKSMNTYPGNSKNLAQPHGITSNGTDTIKVDSMNLKTKESIHPSIINTAEIKRKADSVESKRFKPPVVINRKRDTIIQVDTIYVNKKKKNRNR